MDFRNRPTFEGSKLIAGSDPIPIIGEFGDKVNTLVAGAAAEVFVPFACTIIAWRIWSDLSAYASVDVLAGSTPAGGLSSIAGTDKPALIATTSAIDTTLTGWGTLTIAANTYLRFNLDTVSGPKKVTVALIVVRT